MPGDALFQSVSPVFLVEALVKLAISVVLAGMIGFERERSGHPAGVRTHMLLALGVCLFAICSWHFTQGEATRIAAQIVTGVGFLGAGTIMRSGPEIRGLTTAASLWSTAAIAFAVSIGGSLLVVAVIATVLALMTLVWVSTVERRLLRRVHTQTVRLTVAHRDDLLAAATALAKLPNTDVLGLRVLGTSPDCVGDIDLRAAREGILEEALRIPGVLAASWSI